jgi:phosphate acetyltransferase
MIVANRVDQEDILSLKSKIESQTDIYFTPEVEELNFITIREIKEHLNCDILFGKEKELNRVVRTKLIAAMTSEHYLDRVSEKALIIVPTDRSDIIATTLLALYSKNFPNVAGILLTGNLPLSESINNLLLGLGSLTLPILATSLDTYQAIIKIEAIKAKIASTSERKIALGMGLFFDNIDSNRLLSKLDTPTEPIMTPAMFEYTLFEKARSNKKTIVLPESGDERILRATEIILHRGIANIILLGNPQEIAHNSGILGLDISKATIINPDTSTLLKPFADAFYQMRRHKGLQLHAAQDAMVHTTYFGTMLVHQGLADGMVSGATHTTADTIKPALQIIKTKPGISIVSSVFFMCLDTKVLVYGDCAVNQNPDEHELAQIAISSAQTAKAFGIDPRVAMLSYSTG